jgi:hypothetical protein
MVAMNLIGAPPHRRRKMCVGIPLDVLLALRETPWFYGAVLGGSDCADAAAEQACSCCMHVRPADAGLTRTLKRKTEASLPPFSDFSIDPELYPSRPAAWASRV